MKITPENINNIGDSLGYPIDPGIKDLVLQLNRLGIITTASCEGHLTHGLCYPWVDCEFVFLNRYVEIITQFVPEGLRIEFLRYPDRSGGRYKMYSFRILPEIETLIDGRNIFNRFTQYLSTIND